MSFEENLEKLNEISKKFESDKLSLAESVDLFEESVKLSTEAVDYLKKASGKVKKLKLEMDKLEEIDF